jgi:hypothetical protein
MPSVYKNNDTALVPSNDSYPDDPMARRVRAIVCCWVTFSRRKVREMRRPPPNRGRFRRLSVPFQSSLLPCHRSRQEKSAHGQHQRAKITRRRASPFTIKPGPNNPVGLVWIGLSPGEGFGIHGTPDPSKVSKSESHGCVRLTNWDALRLASALRKGAPVNFYGDEQVRQKTDRPSKSRRSR